MESEGIGQVRELPLPVALVERVPDSRWMGPAVS